MRPLLAATLLSAFVLHADSAGDCQEVIRKAVEALRHRQAAALWLLFDPAMPGYAKLRADTGDLLQVAEAESNVVFRKNEGDDRVRNLEFNWRMEITQQERAASTTLRDENVKCRMEHKDGKWRIDSFAPISLLAPTHASEAWYEIADAAQSLTSPPDDSPVNPTLFMRMFDPKMPGVDKLRENVTALARRGPIESSVELVDNTGDDHARTVEVDWALKVIDVTTSIDSIRKQQHVKFRMEWQGKRWRVTSLEPAGFFAP